jgi:hypothetical protein
LSDASIPRLDAIQKKDSDIGRALQYVQNAVNNIGQQTNAAPVGVTPAPQAHASLTVKGGAGIYDIAIADNSPKFIGHSNFVEYSQDASFSNAHVISLGPSRNHRASLGAGPYHFRSYSAYPTSQPSQPVYHAAVSGAGTVEPPMQQGQGSGTSQTPGAGFGNVPFNAPTQPKRS